MLAAEEVHEHASSMRWHQCDVRVPCSTTADSQNIGSSITGLTSPQARCHIERQLQGLLSIEARVAEGVVA